MKPGTRVLSIGLVGLAIVALLAWGVVGRPLGARAPDPTPIAEPSRAPLELADEDAVGRAVTPAAADAGATADPARTGSLVVRVFDDRTGHPLAGVALRVARERGGPKLLATGTTDARGEARFDAVEANTVIVEAVRQPPYASAFGAVWLEPREHEDLELRLGSGATVRGRAVDDRGAPIEGVAVLLEGDFAPRFGAPGWIHSSAVVSARSGADGRFELANLARMPSNVWIEKGAMKPEQWTSPTLWLRHEDTAVPIRLELRDEGEQDLGDLVIPRAATWSGHVLDARGEPVPGALVTSIDWRLQTRRGGPRSGKPELAGWPGVAEFTLWPGESLSAADGSFELRGRNDDLHLTVITTKGSSHECPVPAFESGARYDGLELRVGDATVIVLEFVDEAGHRIVEPHARSLAGFRPGQRIMVGPKLQIDLRCSEGPVSTSIGADPDGHFRVQIDGTAGVVESLVARLGGYQAVEHTFAGDPTQPLRFVLQEMPVLRLRARIAGEPRPDHSSSPNLLINACLRDPAVWSALPQAERGTAGCCGLGAFISIPWRPGESAIELPVAVDRPFFVRVQQAMGSWSSTFGPWNPGAEWREIEIQPPPVETAAVVSEQRVKPAPARARARLVDARTGDALEGRVHFEHSPGSSPEDLHGIRWLDVGRTPSPWRNVAPGRWLMNAVASGHEPSPSVPIELVSDVEHDLGTFALEPWPKVDVLVLDAAGRPAADGIRVHLGTSGWSTNGTVKGGEGRFVLQSVVPEAGFAAVGEMLAEMTGRSQGMPFAYDGGGALTLRLAPWRRVEARVAVRDMPEREAWIDARLVRDPAQELELGPWQESLRETVSDPDARLFTGWAVPGRYTLRCSSLLAHFLPVQLDIPADGDDVVRVELRPDR